MKISALTLAAVLGITGIVRATDSTDNAVIARVGDSDIKVSDLKPYLAGLNADQQAALTQDPAKLDLLVRTLIAQQLLLKEALATKWDQQPAVAAQLQQLRDRAVSESYLASVSNPPADYPSDADIKAAYEANKDALVVPTRYHVAQIFIAVTKDADTATEAKAKGKLSSVSEALTKSSADFAKVAKSSSDEAASASRGGDIGWLTEAQLQPDGGLREAVAGLAPGKTTKPLRLADGWHIVKLIEVKPSYTASLDEVRPLLVQRLREAKAQENSKAYLASLLEKNPVAIDQIALSNLLKKSSN
jgi:parvulin-like peptidyl-prolyl isomerase